MLIRVQYKNDNYDTVAHFLLDELISSNKIKKFLRSEGWVIPGINPIRVIGPRYDGIERRRHLVLSITKLSEYEQEKSWGEKVLSADVESIIETKRKPILCPADGLKMTLAKRSLYNTYNKTSNETTEKIFVDKGGQLREYKVSGNSTLVPFPVSLAIKYGDNIAEEYPDFILNISESWVFVNTESVISKGTSLLMHFYIPPEDKLLAEIKGKVSGVNRDNAGYPKGMLIKCALFSRKQVQSLENYLEEKKHLIDNKV